MIERYYGTLNEHGWINRVESRDVGISMRFISEWRSVENRIVSPACWWIPRTLYQPPDIGPDVPGGGAV
jgi:hypothetical protein